MKSLSIALSVFMPAGLASGAVLAFGGGQGASGTITGTPGNFVLDAGFFVPTTNTTNPVLFETGGDGIGTVLALVGNNLEVFQDQNSGPEPAFTVDVSGYAGQKISIRLNGDYRPASGARILGLSVVPFSGSVLFDGSSTISTADNRFSGSDGTGFGGINGTLSGNGEAFSPVTGFDVAARDLAGPGSSVLNPTQLSGNLYTGPDADTQRGQAIPSAQSYTTVIPEPSSLIMVLIGSMGLLRRRR